MSDIISLKKNSNYKCNSSLRRNIIILAGEREWQKKYLQILLSGEKENTLWLGNEENELFFFIKTNKANNFLGREKKFVIFDANSNIEVDSFAAISGVVVGGGIFFLLIPPKEEWSVRFTSLFDSRLIESINSNDDLIVIDKDSENVNFSTEHKTFSQYYMPPFLTQDQHNVVGAILKKVINKDNTPIVLISDRGRGKSAALGLVTAELLKSGLKNIVITAPRLSAVHIVFKHVLDMLPAAKSSKGYIEHNESVIKFYPPDYLIENDVVADVFLVDEAAMIPVPILTLFLHKYPQCVFSTTVHGYEGTGRGFALRFFKELDKHKSDWLKLEMKTPIRWADNDPLEKWMFDLLCLNAEIVDVELLGEIDFTKVKIELLNKDELSRNDTLLKEVFSLLVLAHYRTRPKDLQNMLNDENISIYVTSYNAHIIAVALVIREGSFSSSLSTKVYRGQRRPHGNLLAQSLTYHCGVEHAATLDFSRVMRIAVHPELQNKGIGTKLLQYIIKNEKERGRDVIGASFGMNKKLLKFWHKENFIMARIGFTREQTSGEHAAIMLLALTDIGKNIRKEVDERFRQQISFLFDDVLRDISTDIKNIFNFKLEIVKELTLYEKKDLHSFIEYSRNYELCIASISKLVNLNSTIIENKNFPENYRRVLMKKVLDKNNWNEMSSVMELSGKNETRNLLHSAVKHLNNSIEY